MKMHSFRWVLTAVAILAGPGALLGQEHPVPGPTVVLAPTREHPAAFKDPSRAIIYSFLLPGAGQLYAGETVRGAAFLSAFTLGVTTFLVAAGRDSGCRVGTDCRDTFDPMLYTMGGFAIAAGSWIFGIVDAPFTAQRVNKRHGLAQRATVGPILGTSSTGAVAVGLHLGF